MKTQEFRFGLISRACLAVSLLLAISGCSGGGMTLIAIAPNNAQSMDAGQTLAIKVSLVNDSSRGGATFSASGGGTLNSPAITSTGDSDFVTVIYTAPSVTTATHVTVTATSVNTPAQTASLAITVNPALVISTTVLPSGVVATPYSAALASAGGTGTVKWSLASGTLPTGLSLNTVTGIVSGMPSTFGTFTFAIAATDASATPAMATQIFSITINPTLPTITTTSLPNAVVGTAYSQQLAYVGGSSGSPAFSIVSGSLPLSSGLTLSASGLISGTPALASAGTTYTFTVTLTVGAQASTPVQFTLTVPALPVVSTTAVPSGNVGIAYSQQLAHTGGNGGTATWAIVAGSLPSSSGLKLSPSGLLSGSPTSATTYNFSAAVTVGAQTSLPQSLTLVINNLVVTSGTAASGEIGLSFLFHLTAVGGTAPYTWSLTAGSSTLPAGLNLNATTGLISGSPSTTTGSPFTNIIVEATDSLGAIATQSMIFAINPARSNVNNGELSGQYAFLLSGFDATGKPLTSAGKFIADGNGNIVSGITDINGTGLATPVSNATLSASTYSVGSDNRGTLTLTTSSGTTIYVIALNTIAAGVANTGTITEFDTSGQSLTGVLALQTPAAFTTASITGGFAFGTNGFAANSTALQPLRRVTIGEIQFNGAGGFTSAEFLASGSGSATPTVPTSGTIAVAANGRGTLSLSLPSGGGTMNFAVYAVSAKKLFLISTDAASGDTATRDLLSGQALAQTITNGNFNTGSLSGVSVFHAERLSTNSSGALVADAQLGLYTFATGKISLTSDENAGGAITTNTLSGGYIVAPNGRVTYQLASGFGGCTNCASGDAFAYMVGQNEGYILDLNNPVSNGFFEPQTTTGFSAASLTGAFTAGSLEPLVQNAPYVSAALNSNGAGSITDTLDENTAGTLAPDIPVGATYSVGSTGRTAISANTGNSVLYTVSATKALLLDLSSGAPVIQEVLHQ